MLNTKAIVSPLGFPGHIQWYSHIRDVRGFAYHSIFTSILILLFLWCRTCNGVAIMHRRSDLWLNMTHILKAMGFNKPQRTEFWNVRSKRENTQRSREGTGSTKVMSMVTGSQKMFNVTLWDLGTWIPLDRLCKQYHCDNLLRPILEFSPDSKSPTCPQTRRCPRFGQQQQQ